MTLLLLGEAHHDVFASLPAYPSFIIYTGTMAHRQPRPFGHCHDETVFALVNVERMFVLLEDLDLARTASDPLFVGARDPDHAGEFTRLEIFERREKCVVEDRDGVQAGVASS